MTDRKRTKSEERNYAELMSDLYELDLWRRQNEMKLRNIPEGWHHIEREIPCTPKKAKVTMNLDADMLRWFRAMGKGYQSRVNAILRVYMLAVLSKEVETQKDRSWKGDPI